MKQKFQEGDQVRVTKGRLEGQVGIVNGIIHVNKRNLYEISLDNSGVEYFYSYELEDFQTHTKEKFLYEIGQEVRLTQKAKEWFSEQNITSFDTNKVYTISSHVYQEGKPGYKLEGVISYGFFNDDLILNSVYKQEHDKQQFKYEVGDVVALTDRAIRDLRKEFAEDLDYDFGSLDELILGPLEVTDRKINSEDKIVYDVDNLSEKLGVLFYEDEVEEYKIDETECVIDPEGLEDEWKTICNDYLYAFCDRHEYAYEPDMWVADEVGTTVEVCDMSVSMDDIRYDVDNQIDPELFSKWYWKSVEVYELTNGQQKYMNYPSFCKGAPDEWTEEQIERIRNAHKRVQEAQQAFEDEIEALKTRKNLF